MTGVAPGAEGGAKDSGSAVRLQAGHHSERVFVIVECDDDSDESDESDESDK